MLCFCRFRQHHRHRSCPVISRREVNESAWAAPPVLSHIWPRSHHIVFPEHCHSSGTACDKRKVLQRRAHQQTNGKQKNMRYLFREPFRAGKFRITWCVIGHLSHPPNVPLPHPSPCRLIVGTAMTALVCVFVFARPVHRLFVCLFTKWLQTGGKVGHVCCCSVRRKYLTSCSPLKITMSLLLFIPLFCYFYGLFFRLSVICYYLPFMISFHLLNSFGCSLSVLK